MSDDERLLLGDTTGCYCTECLRAIAPDDCVVFFYFGTCGECIDTSNEEFQ
jgi:hypothetical protein